MYARARTIGLAPTANVLRMSEKSSVVACAAPGRRIQSPRQSTDAIADVPRADRPRVAVVRVQPQAFRDHVGLLARLHLVAAPDRLRIAAADRHLTHDQLVGGLRLTAVRIARDPSEARWTDDIERRRLVVDRELDRRTRTVIRVRRRAGIAEHHW